MKKISIILGLVFMLLATAASAYWIYEESTTANWCAQTWNATYPCANVYDDNWSSYGQIVNGTPAIYEGTFANTIDEGLMSSISNIYIQVQLNDNYTNLTASPSVLNWCHTTNWIAGFYFNYDYAEGEPLETDKHLVLVLWCDDGGGEIGTYDGYDTLYDVGLWIEINCTPEWSCSLYGDCNTTDQRPCIEAEDLNNCSINYTGNYSEFEPEECDYCTPEWYCSNLSECLPSKTKECYNVSDTNGCYSQTGLESDAFDGEVSDYNEGCGGYTPVYATGDITKEVVDMFGEGGAMVLEMMGIIVTTVAVGFVVYRFRKFGKVI